MLSFTACSSADICRTGSSWNGTLDGILVGNRSGSRFIEEIGTYDPNQEPSVVKIDEEAAKKWLQTGAQPTETVAKLFKQAGIEK